MSYARFGDDSDVYVFRSSTTWHCCGCKINNEPNVEFPSLEALAAHMIDHRAAGSQVPDYLFDRIIYEQQTGTDLISGRKLIDDPLDVSGQSCGDVPRNELVEYH